MVPRLTPSGPLAVLLVRYMLCCLNQDITRLLSLAASSISLLTLPQTDGPNDNLPQGEERSEQFVLEVSEYFERLDVIQVALRSSLAHIRHSRIAPSAINAPPPNFIPPSLGVGLPSADGVTPKKNRGLQEERLDLGAWKGILDALTRMKTAQDTRDEPPPENKETQPMTQVNLTGTNMEE